MSEGSDPVLVAYTRTSPNSLSGTWAGKFPAQARPDAHAMNLRFMFSSVDQLPAQPTAIYVREAERRIRSGEQDSAGQIKTGTAARAVARKTGWGTPSKARPGKRGQHGEHRKVGRSSLLDWHSLDST